MKSEVFIQKLKMCGWTFEKNTDTNSKINPDELLEAKIRKAPKEYSDLLSAFNTLANNEDNIWFLSYSDFLNSDEEEGFRWNEFELQSLEYADEDEAKEITSFWANVLPFLMSVKNDYAYAGLILEGDKKGRVVVGNEPMYEDVVEVAESLSDFFDLYISVLNNEQEAKSLNMLI